MARKSSGDWQKIGLWESRSYYYTNSGRLEAESKIRIVLRNKKGQFVAGATGYFPTFNTADTFKDDVFTGRIDGKKAVAILKARKKAVAMNTIISGMESIIQLYEDKIPITDYDLGKLYYLMDQFENPYQFDEFYQQNKELINNVYIIGSPRNDSDSNITFSTKKRRSITKKLISELQKFLSVSDAELEKYIMFGGELIPESEDERNERRRYNDKGLEIGGKELYQSKKPWLKYKKFSDKK